MARQAICEVKCDSASDGKFAETVVSCKCAYCESKAGGGKRSHVAFMSGDLIAVRARIASIRSIGPHRVGTTNANGFLCQVHFTWALEYLCSR